MTRFIGNFIVLASVLVLVVTTVALVAAVVYLWTAP